MARCNGFKELQEAFRVLVKLNPKTLDWKLAKVSKGERKVEIEIWQRYTIGKEIVLHSRIFVEHDDNGRIISIEERWREVPLLSGAPFSWVRRLNGLMAYLFTPYLKV